MSTISTTTRVLPGGRIEVESPELREGETVRVTVERADIPRLRREDILRFLESRPPGPRSAATWEELERSIQQERDSWDR